MHWLARRYRGVSIALFLLLLISQVPARTLAWLAPENLTVSGLTGTVWTGEAARAWVTIDGKPLMLGRLDWQIRPWRLFWSTPVFLSATWAEQKLKTRLGPTATGKWMLRDTQVSIDAEIFRLFFPLYLGGTASGNFAHLEVANARVVSVLGAAFLSDAVWTARGGNLPLGTYHISLDSDKAGSGIRGEVKTSEGALVLEGTVMLSPDSYQVALRATGPVARDESFRRAVTMLASPTADGFEIFLQGQL